MFKYYQVTTEYSCGIDLHSRQMYICLMNKDGKVLVHRNIRSNDFEYFLKLVEPYKSSLTVCCECTFNWYWLADACMDAGLEFVLGHALYMRAIHSFKTKNDKRDCWQIAHLLRSNLIPPAYVYPREKRSVRALLRQRTAFVWKRAEIITRVTMGVMAKGHKALNSSQRPRDKWYAQLKEVYTDPIDITALDASIHMIEQFDSIIGKLDWAIHKHTNDHYGVEYNTLKTVPGIGVTLGLIILYEVDDISRFKSVQDFLSYCRLAKGTVASAGKIKGSQGAKIGNGYLKYAFHEAAVLGKRRNPDLRKYHQRLEARKGKHLANSIIACKLARAVYFMLRDNKVFDVSKVIRRRAA
ncbi:IS110 family transposase [Verrucomicrobiota bacterium]